MLIIIFLLSWLPKLRALQWPSWGCRAPMDTAEQEVDKEASPAALSLLPLGREGCHWPLLSGSDVLRKLQIPLGKSELQQDAEITLDSSTRDTAAGQSTLHCTPSLRRALSGRVQGTKLDYTQV